MIGGARTGRERDWKLMKVLVTGATGFLGSHLCRRIARDGHELTVFRRSSSSTAELAGLELRHEIGDITDAEAVARAVSGQDIVIHAAAQLAYWGYQKQAQEKINVEGTRNVVEACLRHQVKRLVHVSSVAAIGIPNGPDHPATEEFIFNLESSDLIYHLSKRSAEKIVLAAVKDGLDAIIVNPSTIFGPYGARYRGAEMVQKVRQTRVVPYFLGGLCVVHVGDVVEGIMRAMTHGAAGQRYILGGENLTFKALAERAATAMNLRRRFIPVTPVITGLAAMVLEPLGRWRRRQPKITYATHYCASRYHFYDSGKARKSLGYAPRDFSAILDECVEFVRS